MNIIDQPVLPRPFLPAARAWPGLAAACLVGLLEWAALCRSRSVDAWHASRHRVSRG
ncbi:MAG: hypothetical protein H7242_00145 [Microbacteriaceae bacterium]|nr:hypothetical protein [Burkholderiaceae bacterium]